MDERSLQDLISKWIPDEIEQFTAQVGDDEQHTRAVELLQLAAAGPASAAGDEIGHFLEGRGDLLDTTRAAVARGGSSAVSSVRDFLVQQMHLSPALASILAPLLVKILPKIGTVSGPAGAATKPRPKKKPKTSSSAKPKKPKSASSAKPKKPKAASSAKPKKPKASSESSKPKKPRTSSSKKPAAKPKRRTRAGEIPLGDTAEQE
jgi:hypothetical protein